MNSIVFHLSETRNADLARLLSTVSRNPYSDFDGFKSQIRQLPISLSLYFCEALDLLREAVEHPGALLLRNLPIDTKLPDTPQEYKYPISEKITYISEGALTLIGCYLGSIFSFREEHEGVLIRSITPNNKKNSAVTGGSYGTHELKLHTEVAWADHRPDFIILFCLRKNPLSPAITTISFSQRAYEQLSPDDKVNLRLPAFHIALPELFRSIENNEKLWSEKVSIISGPENAISVRANFNFMRCFNIQISKSLKAFEDSSLKYIEEISLNPGDMLILDNRKVLHGRYGFAAAFNGQDRWLQQVYAYADPWSVRHKISEKNILKL
jgi:alpha-ketoglutarate-dependent taurine dioxygenase